MADSFVIGKCYVCGKITNMFCNMCYLRDDNKSRKYFCINHCTKDDGIVSDDGKALYFCNDCCTNCKYCGAHSVGTVFPSINFIGKYAKCSLCGDVFCYVCGKFVSQHDIKLIDGVRHVGRDAWYCRQCSQKNECYT